MSDMHLSSTAQRSAAKTPGSISYGVSRGITVTTNRAPTIAVMDALISAQPNTISFQDLCQRAQITADDAQRLAREITDYWMSGLVEIFTAPIALPTVPGEKPLVSPVARYQLQNGNRATTLRHGVIALDGLARDLALLCDGIRTRHELAREMSQRATFTHAAEDWLGNVLAQLARSALLVPQ